MKKHTLILILAFINLKTTLGQNKVEYNNYDTLNNNINDSSNIYNSIIDRVSLLYKLYDFGNGCKILPNQNYIKNVINGNNFSLAKNEILNYLNHPFDVSFGEKQGYLKIQRFSNVQLK